MGAELPDDVHARIVELSREATRSSPMRSTSRRSPPTWNRCGSCPGPRVTGKRPRGSTRPHRAPHAKRARLL